MKINYYTELFLKQPLAKSITSKKVNSRLKRYFCGSRACGHVVFDYESFMTLYRKLVLFIQASTRAKTPFVFFFENINCSSLYKEVAHSCNESICFIPATSSWLLHWSPQYFTASKELSYLTQAGIGVFSTTCSYVRLLQNLIKRGWPLILSISAEKQKKIPVYLTDSIYAIPTTYPTSLLQQYFSAVVVSTTITREKLRL